MRATDPNNGLSFGVAQLFTGPPAIEIQQTGVGQFKLIWNWPTAFASKLNFSVLAATSLGSGFTSIPLSPVVVGPDTYQVVLPPPDTGFKYYQITVSLK